jgi:predicted nucleic acid-binding protein
MSYLLDTNVVSNGIKPQPDESLARWISDQFDNELFLSAISVGEIKRGILELPSGRKRTALEQWYSGSKGPRRMFGSRIVAFDERAAEAWAELIADGRRKGRPRSPIDMMIAATAVANGLTVVTLNERDFEGIVAHMNPLRV